MDLWYTLLGITYKIHWYHHTMYNTYQIKYCMHYYILFQPKCGERQYIILLLLFIYWIG